MPSVCGQMFQACLQKYQFDGRVQDMFEEMNLNSARLLQNAHPSIKSEEPAPGAVDGPEASAGPQ